MLAEEDIEKLLDELDLRQIFGLAVKSEMEAQQRYSLLAEMVEDDQLKDHIRKFVEEEKKHERQFREIFSDFFPDRTMEIPDDSVKPAPDLQLEARQGTVGLLKKALESEQESESFYHLLAERLEQQESRRIVAYFASVERDHYEFIRAQLEELGSEEDGHK